MTIGATAAQSGAGGVRRRLNAVPDTAATSGETLKSVGTALDVLDCFALDTELGVSDIARRLGIAKSTAHRLLTTLCSRGMTVKNPQTGMYRLGLHVFELGTLAQTRLRLRQTAMPVLEDLRRITGQTVLLCVADGADIVVIEQLGGGGAVVELGEGHRRYPSHATSAGLAIAAFNAEAAVARRTAGFPPRARGTIRNAGDFDRALTETRRRGVSVGAEGVEEGVCTVAAPIRDLNGVAHAAVVIVGRPEDFYPVLERSSRLVVTVAGRIARALRSGDARPEPLLRPAPVDPA